MCTLWFAKSVMMVAAASCCTIIGFWRVRHPCCVPRPSGASYRGTCLVRSLKPWRPRVPMRCKKLRQRHLGSLRGPDKQDGSQGTLGISSPLQSAREGVLAFASCLELYKVLASLAAVCSPRASCRGDGIAYGCPYRSRYRHRWSVLPQRQIIGLLPVHLCLHIYIYIHGCIIYVYVCNMYRKFIYEYK